METSTIRPLLVGHVALVTGASSGIGRATARVLAAAGAKVAVNHFGHDDEAESIVAEIEAAGGAALAIAADVSDEAAVEAMFRQAVERFGTVHVLVNNAGIQSDAAFAEMTLEQWRRVIDVNLTGQFLCARAAIREFLRRGACDVSVALGKIVFTSSVHQIIPWARHANYAASKGGVKLLAQSLAQEVAEHRIRVNVVAPGAIRTPINHDAWKDERSLEGLLKLIPYHRIGEPEDVAKAIAWLASDESDYVTGATLVIDGGMQLYPGFGEGGG
jgi:glucose 1-dehydrogenase